MKIFPTKFPRYYVSEDGKAWREKQDGTIVEVGQHKRGGSNRGATSKYMAINVSLYDDNGKFQKQIRYYVHRLVAETLIENPQGLPEVDHKNGKHTDNVVSNLRWCTGEQNKKWKAERARANK